MKLTDLQNREIILVSGNLCSGKGYYCEKNYPGYHHIVVSDIVRSLVNQTSRTALQDTKHLDSTIVEVLIREIYKYPKVVVDGIRQISIIKHLQQTFGDQIKDIIWLDTADDVAKERFAKRANIKDDSSYEQARAKDAQLGIGDVESYIRSKHRVIPN